MRDLSWTNWFGNQSCTPGQIRLPKNEEQLRDCVRDAAREGLGIRVVGGGHSLPPVVNTDGMLMDIAGLSGAMDIDAKAQTATIPAGKKLSAIFDPLWDAGFAFKNMGELAESTIAGAVSTGAHGTGLGLQCTSASVTAARLVIASGEVLEISEERDSELLSAAQVSVGMLGVFTELTLGVSPAYDLVERSAVISVEEAVDGWNDAVSAHRHYSYYYIATPAAAAAFADQLSHLPPGSSDLCYATIIDKVRPGAPHETDGDPHVIRDRMNRVLTIEFDPNYREIEYAVPAEVGMQTFLDLRRMLQAVFPDYAFPVNVRYVDGDAAFLSPFNGGPRVVFSVSDDPAAPWDTVLAAAENLFLARGGRPHWGKEHALTKSLAASLFPDFERFRAIRRELDPDGLFLNPHLEAIFG